LRQKKEEKKISFDNFKSKDPLSPKYLLVFNHRKDTHPYKFSLDSRTYFLNYLYCGGSYCECQKGRSIKFEQNACMSVIVWANFLHVDNCSCPTALAPKCSFHICFLCLSQYSLNKSMAHVPRTTSHGAKMELISLSPVSGGSVTHAQMTAVWVSDT
jgi:hypothetical protein